MRYYRLCLIYMLKVLILYFPAYYRLVFFYNLHRLENSLESKTIPPSFSDIYIVKKSGGKKKESQGYNTFIAFDAIIKLTTILNSLIIFMTYLSVGRSKKDITTMKSISSKFFLHENNFFPECPWVACLFCSVLTNTAGCNVVILKPQGQRELRLYAIPFMFCTIVDIQLLPRNGCPHRQRRPIEGHRKGSKVPQTIKAPPPAQGT